MICLAGLGGDLRGLADGIDHPEVPRLDLGAGHDVVKGRVVLDCPEHPKDRKVRLRGKNNRIPPPPPNNNSNSSKYFNNNVVIGMLWEFRASGGDQRRGRRQDRHWENRQGPPSPASPRPPPARRPPAAHVGK